MPAWGGISIQLTIDIVTKQLYRNPGIDLDPLMNKPAETVAREKHPNTMKAREEPGSKGNPRFWAWDYKWLRFTDVKSSQTVQKVWKYGIEHILNKTAFILYRVHLNWTLVCFYHYWGFIRRVRTRNLWVWTKTSGESESVRASRSWSAFIQTLALFNCRDETIRLWIDATAGNEPNLPFVGSSSWVKNL